MLTGSILSRVAAFEKLAVIASQHHEKLDAVLFEALRAVVYAA
ncbi:MAG TPA: hypothetical protein VGN16_07980 [Acidobacteriaceae bacterium]|jgi:hypothetical protein